MISSEAQRTLVKSPPELWAELSDPEALARHLGELGEIRITKVDPEQSVEWEAEAARGRIELKPSGWGTKVALQISRELPQEQTPAPAPAPEAAQPEPERAQPEAAGPAPPAGPESPARRGFFARLFKRRAKTAPGAAPEEPEPPPAEEPEPAAQTDERLLDTVLDRLGAAHHRPFSRS